VSATAQSRASTAGAIALSLVVLSSCAHAGVLSAGRAGKTQCVAAPVHRGRPPAWTASAWADSSPGFTAPYALASNDTAAAFFFADPLRAGHPTNPSNKVLWVVRFPRDGKPLDIIARRPAGSSRVVRIHRPADSGPGEIYPSYVDLPESGCWQLTLAWGVHRASIDVEIQGAASVPQPVTGAPIAAPVPEPLTGDPLARRTGLRLLIADNPPFVLDVDTGAITPVAGVDTRGRPVLSVQAVGRDAVFWLQRSSGRDTAGQIYVLRHGSTRARRIATGLEVAPAQQGRAVWLLQRDKRNPCTLTERRLDGRTLARPRLVACSSQLVAVGAGGAVLVRGRAVIAPDTGRTLLRVPQLWAVAGDYALSAGRDSGPPLVLTDLRSGKRRPLSWPSTIRFDDQAVLRPGGQILAVDFADPAYRMTGTQVTDVWLLDPATGRFLHAPGMPAAVHLKAESMAWASGNRLVILAGPDGAAAGRGLVAVWTPGAERLGVRAVTLPARTSGSDAFVAW
jgi:hypothetical protein